MDNASPSPVGATIVGSEVIFRGLSSVLIRCNIVEQVGFDDVTIIRLSKSGPAEVEGAQVFALAPPDSWLWYAPDYYHPHGPYRSIARRNVYLQLIGHDSWVLEVHPRTGAVVNEYRESEPPLYVPFADAIVITNRTIGFPAPIAAVSLFDQTLLVRIDAYGHAPAGSVVAISLAGIELWRWQPPYSGDAIVGLSRGTPLPVVSTFACVNYTLDLETGRVLRSEFTK